MIVMKFGGVALADARSIANVADVVSAARADEPVVIASAMKGVTDLLLKWLELAVAVGDGTAVSPMAQLKSEHENAIWDVVSDQEIRSELLFFLNRRLLELEKVMDSISVLREFSPRCRDYVLSFGERFSTRILAGALRCRGIDAEAVDGESILLTDATFGRACPDYPQCESMVRKVIGPIVMRKAVPVVMGFVGRDPEGHTTTIGRGGSDLTAAIVASGLDVAEIRYYKEVDGVMSADPLFVEAPRKIMELSYEEVAELSFFGAKILHPIAMRPIRQKRIPVSVRNIAKPSEEGTRITEEGASGGRAAQALTSMCKVAIVTVEGGGLLDNPRIAGRVLTRVAEADVDILMISQSSSEQSLCLVIPQADQARVLELLRHELELEILKGIVDTIGARSGLTIVAIVGRGLRWRPDIAAEVLMALALRKEDVHLVAQGASGVNLSLVVATPEVKGVLRAVHAALGMGERDGSWKGGASV